MRTNEEITATEAGRSFSGQLAQDIVDSEGRVLAPQGSPTTLTVYRADAGGTVGTPVLEVGVRQVRVNGRDLRMVSDASEQRGKEGLGRNRRTAEHVGAGAVLGTVVGAAGGAATQVVTRGKQVRIPTETVLRFRLDEPVRLSGD